MSIKQPVTQVRLTNVAVVRLKAKGKRFEIACYKNKVLSWRNGVETDLDEVLQIHRVFSNVSKGIVAKAAELRNSFGTADEDNAIRLILEKGDVQVSDKERKADLDAKFKEVASIVQEKCVNRDTRRPFSVEMIETAMCELHFSVLLSRPSKQQALQVMQVITESNCLPLTRARMRIQIDAPATCAKQMKLKEKLLLLPSLSISNEEWVPPDWNAVVTTDPGQFGAIENLVKELSKGKASITIVDMHENSIMEEIL